MRMRRVEADDHHLRRDEAMKGEIRSDEQYHS